MLPWGRYWWRKSSLQDRRSTGSITLAGRWTAAVEMSSSSCGISMTLRVIRALLRRLILTQPGMSAGSAEWQELHRKGDG